MSYGSQWEQGREPISPITQGPSERHTVLLSLYCVLGLLWWPHSHREAPGWGIPARCQTGFLWRQETIFWLFVPLLCFHSLSRPCNPYVSIIMMIDLEMLCFVAHSDLQFKQLRSTNEQITNDNKYYIFLIFTLCCKKQCEFEPTFEWLKVAFKGLGDLCLQLTMKNQKVNWLTLTLFNIQQKMFSYRRKQYYFDVGW